MDCYVGSIYGTQILGTVAKERGRILQKGKGVLDVGGPQADLDLLLKCFYYSCTFWNSSWLSFSHLNFP